MKMTNKTLQQTFHYLNERFFDGRIPDDYKVYFKKMREDDGLHYQGPREIAINADFKSHPDVATLVLLHELAHADLPDYIGQKSEEHHGMQFQAKIWDLIKKGAYEGLL
jgi:predicted SprT family Zn-dependent metalloprotease